MNPIWFPFLFFLAIWGVFALADFYRQRWKRDSATRVRETRKDPRGSDYKKPVIAECQNCQQTKTIGLAEYKHLAALKPFFHTTQISTIVERTAACCDEPLYVLRTPEELLATDVEP